MSRAAPGRASGAQDDQIGYVIEKHINSELCYWNGHSVKLGDRAWSEKHEDAIRFARFQDGATVLGWLLGSEGRVVQHLWFTPTAASPSDDSPAVRASGEPKMERTALDGSLTIRFLQYINAKRAERWHGLNSWSALEWAGAMAGEAGEACNAAKKLKRIEDQIANINLEEGRSLTDRESASSKIVDEIADTVIYGVLLAERVGMDLEEAIRRKFNRKSEEYGFPERIPPNHAPRAATLSSPSAQELRDALAFIEREGYRRCDIAACNCDSWHGGHASQRLCEINDAVVDSGIEMNGKTILAGVQEALALSSPSVAESPTPEVCLCAAVLMPDGYIVRGHRHCDAMQTAGGIPRYATVRGMPQGFVTSLGRFVDRKEGARLQIAAGIESADKDCPYLNGELYSEDLY